MRSRLYRLMRALVAAATMATVSLGAQRLLPPELIDASTIYLGMAEGFKANWIDVAATEFEEQGRLTVVDDPAEADLLAVFTSHRDGSATFLGTRYKVFRVEITDVASGLSVWTDAREVQWTDNGAVKDMVKDLNRALRDGVPMPAIGAR